MNKRDMRRLEHIDSRVNEIFLEYGLKTTKINFEVVTAERMIEAMAYRLPSNFSHWSFGRDYEKAESAYRASGHGIPYEMVWNSNKPTALLVDTNPFALNVIIIGHVYGHVDFNLSNIVMKRSRDFGDVIGKARSAKWRFRNYEKSYGVEEVERVIDAALTFQLHRKPDLFADDVLVMPEYDILKFMIECSPKMTKPWIKDVVSVVREQIMAILPNNMVQMINEGWATFMHCKMIRQLAKEKLITPAEHEQAILFHAEVSQKSKKKFNVYSVGLAFWEMIEDKWNKGKFGTEWEACKDRDTRANWDRNLGLGKKKTLELRKSLTDRTAIENYFDDEFIRDQQMYVWKSEVDKSTGKEKFVVAEKDPEAIRQILIQQHTTAGIPSVAVIDGNYEGRGELLLKHFFSGFELDQRYENGALEKLYFLWQKPVHLITYEIVDYDKYTKRFALKEIVHTYSSIGHKYKPQK